MADWTEFNWDDYKTNYTDTSSLYGLDLSDYSSYMGSAYDPEIYGALKDTVLGGTASSGLMDLLGGFDTSGIMDAVSEYNNKFNYSYLPGMVEDVGIEGGYQDYLTSQYRDAVSGQMAAAQQALGDTYFGDKAAYQGASRLLQTEGALAGSSAIGQAATEAAQLQLTADLANQAASSQNIANQMEWSQYQDASIQQQLTNLLSGFSTAGTLQNQANQNLISAASVEQAGQSDLVSSLLAMMSL